MSDLPSTPPTKTPPSTVAPTPASSSDPSPQQGTDRQPTNAKGAAESGREITNAPAVTLSASVAGLHEGATIKGQIAGNDASGRPTISADAATLAVLTNTTLKTGQAVVLNVVATAPNLRASVVEIDGTPPPRPQELRLAVVDIPPDRLAARAKIDAIIAAPPEALAPGPRSSTTLALFIGQSIDAGATPPALPPGSVVTAEIEAVSRPKPQEKPSTASRTPPAVAANTVDPAATAPSTRTDPPTTEAKPPAEPLLRFGQPTAEPVPAPDRIETSVAPRTTPTVATSTTATTAVSTTDVPQSNVAPAPPITPPAAAPVETPAIASSPPAAIVPTSASVAVPGSVSFTGNVVGTTVENRAIIETPSGLFAIDTAGQVEAGAIVTFSVGASSVVVADSAKPPTPPPPNVGFPAGFTTTAVVSGPPVLATSNTGVPPQVPPLPSGTQLSVRVLGPAVPIEPLATVVPNVGLNPAPAGTPPNAVVTEGIGATAAKPQQSTAAGSTQSSTSPGSQRASVSQPAQTAAAPQQVVEPLHTPQPEPSAVAKDPLPPLTGLVVGHSVSGQAVVQTPVGLLTIDGLEAAPRDSAIQLELRAQPPTPPSQTATAATQMTPQSILLTLGQEWQTLKEIVTVVAANDAAAAQRFVSNSAPAMNNRLASSVLFFFVAVQGGVSRTWLGDAATKALERAGRRDLIDRLGDDFSNMRRLSEERGPGDWRTFLFPFYDGEELQQIRMFTRQGDDIDEEEDEEGRKRRSVRFVVEVNLSQLGELQLDGLVQDRRFDLIVRSKSDLTPEMRENINTIFADGVETTGFEGSVIFEKAARFPVSPYDEVLRGAEGDQVRA